MLENFHVDYRRHMKTLEPLFQKHQILFHGEISQEERRSIFDVLKEQNFIKNMDLLLAKTPSTISFDKIKDNVGIMGFALDTLFFKEEQKKTIYQEAIFFLAAFFIRVLYDFLIAHPEIRKNNEMDARMDSMFAVLINNIENKESCDIIRKYPDLVQQKRELIDFSLRTLGGNIFKRENLEFQIQRKNAKHDGKSGKFNGQLIYHKDSLMWLGVDPDVVSVVLAPFLTEILNNKRLRTQFIIYPNGQGRHTLLLDVQKSGSMLQCICIESAADDAQFDFLANLKLFFEAKRMAFDLIACQADLQRDGDNCGVFSLALASIVSGISFEELKVQQLTPPLLGVNESNKEKTLRAFMEETKIPFFSVKALGEKAILMAQSSNDMEQLLLMAKFSSGNREDMSTVLTATKKTKEQWEKLYGLKFGAQAENRFTYIEHRRARLEAKEKMGPPLSLEEAKMRVQKDKVENLTPGQVLRRYAAGQGPDEGWSAILQAAIAAEVLNEPKPVTKEGDHPFTALDFAVQYKQRSRAFDLRKRGAKSWKDFR